MDFDRFSALVDEIRKLGYDVETAADFAAQIGDTPCVDDNGDVLVTDAKGQTVRLRLKGL